MKKKWTIVAFSICITIVVGLIATIIVLASGTQGVGTSVSVLYVATDIEGTVTAKYSKVNKNTGAVISTTDMVTSSGSKTVSFLSTAPTTTSLLNPTESNIALTAEQDLIITYTFTAVATYYATLEYKDSSTSASNIEFSYALNDGAYTDEMSMPIEVAPDHSTTYSIKLHIANTARNANLSGSLNWALTKDGGKTPSGSDEKVAISFANSSGNCKIDSTNCKVVYNSDKSKFKITGVTPTISNGSVTNLADLTNTNGSEFYYFATNSAVVGTTGYTDPGTTYYISGLGTSANPACESWYDTPTDSTTLYATFMTPTHTSATSLSRGTNAGNVIFSHSVTQLPSASFVMQATPSPVQLANLIVVPNSVLSVGSSSTTSSLDNKSKKDEVNAPPQSRTGSFFVCSLIKTVVLSNSVTSITDFQFWGCTNLTKIFIPEGIVRIGDGAFSKCSGLASITMPNSVAYIGTSAFSSCSSLISIIIPESVTRISSYAFSNCSALTSITIPNSVTSIEYGAFDGCSGLTSITIPNSVTSIEVYAFYGCSGLTSITIPNSVTSIESDAFRGCSGLTSVTIGSGVTSIGDFAFDSCSGLTSITVSENNTTYRSSGNCLIKKSDNSLILGCKTSVIPNSVTSIGDYAFKNCSGLTSITIPNSVTSIGNDAFQGCSGLTSITIGNSVTSIGDKAFYSCSGLTSVTIGSGVTSIGKSAFLYCSKLTSVTFADTSKTWTVKIGSTVKASDVWVANSAQNATYLTDTYNDYTWTKNS